VPRSDVTLSSGGSHPLGWPHQASGGAGL